MTQYRVCGITKEGKQTAWSCYSSRAEMMKKANQMLNQPYIIAIKTWEIILP